MSNDIASVRRVVDCCCGKSPFSLPNFLLFLARSREGEKTNYTAVSHTRFFHQRGGALARFINSGLFFTSSLLFPSLLP